jgi:AbrB family looped-hinge helix DNA binding protein
MTEVLVTRKGQTTIPVEMRRKYAIEEGSRLEAIDTGYGILLKPEQTTVDLAGSGSKKARVSEMKHLLDRMRAEDA